MDGRANSAALCGRHFSFVYTKLEKTMSYKLTQIADAVGMNARTLSDWLDRGIVPAPKTGKGNHRSFGVRDVDRVAIVHELTRIGLPTGEAAKAASVFSDDRSYKRPRAQLHKEGKTFLVVDRDCARVVNAHTREEFEALMAGLWGSDYGVIALNVGETLRRVDAALDGKGTPKPPAAAIYRNGREMRDA
jgi:DNA-binding transcriptional MerR regulator